jgi:hypothetical protein
MLRLNDEIDKLIYKELDFIDLTRAEFIASREKAAGKTSGGSNAPETH